MNMYNGNGVFKEIECYRPNAIKYLIQTFQSENQRTSIRWQSQDLSWKVWKYFHLIVGAFYFLIHLEIVMKKKNIFKSQLIFFATRPQGLFSEKFTPLPKN